VKKLYRRWRPNGGAEFFMDETGKVVSEAEARKGEIIGESQRKPVDLVESFQLLGMSKLEATIAADGLSEQEATAAREEPRRGQPVNLVESFQALGMSQAEARIAARGY